MVLLKSELIEKLAKEHAFLPVQDIKSCVDILLKEIETTLAEGGTVELRGFGVFSTRKKPSRKGRNPRTGEELDVEEKYVPYFRAGKVLQERMNPF